MKRKRLIIKLLELADMEEVGSFEITRYNINDFGNIEIQMVKVLDKNGKYIKFAKLKNVLPYLSQYPITFKQLEDGTNN